jgi:arylsulfatase A
MKSTPNAAAIAPLLLALPLVACGDDGATITSGAGGASTTSASTTTGAGAGGTGAGAGGAGTGGEAATTGTTGAGGAPPEHPNFVMIYGEARGWTSTSTQLDESVADSKSDVFLTPNLDQLAADGMSFADFYAPSPRCMPSRAAYFTGKSPAQLHMTFVSEKNGDGLPTGSVIPPVPITDLPTTHATVASMLKSVGYATAHFGKWHAGKTDPSDYGFDESDGPTTNIGPGGDTTPNPDEAFGTAARGIDFMQRKAGDGVPFYLQISHYGGDDPGESLPETYAAETARLPGESVKTIGESAVIRDMDATVGQVLDGLDTLGLRGTTYVLFTADHGRAGTNANLPLNQGKGSTWEGGIRVPLFLRGPGIGAGTHTHVRASQVDLLPTIAELAHLSGPLPEGVEGGSLWGVLQTGTGTPTRPRSEFVVHFPHYDKDPLGPSSAILDGSYKLIRFYESGARVLIDLDADLGEDNDLSAAMPDKMTELDTKLTDYLTAVGAQLPTGP